MYSWTIKNLLVALNIKINSKSLINKWSKVIKILERVYNSRPIIKLIICNSAIWFYWSDSLPPIHTESMASNRKEGNYRRNSSASGLDSTWNYTSIISMPSISIFGDISIVSQTTSNRTESKSLSTERSSTRIRCNRLFSCSLKTH